MDNIEKKILEKLRNIENTHDVKIIHAIESGSRGWGFAAPNADYDCRFIYVHKQEYYLSVFERREFIEFELNEVYDIKGYDISRALNYIVKSQAVINEWLSSNVSYIKHDAIAAQLKELASSFFNPIPVCHHYLSLARKMLAEIKNSEQAKIKKYFYILRPIANLNYIHKYNKMPPMEFDKTLKAISMPQDIFSEVEKLKAQKMVLLEHDKISSNKILIEYFNSELSLFEEILKRLCHNKNTNYSLADDLFRKIIKEAWQ